MAHTKLAKKRIRIAQQQRLRNKSIRSQCKTFTAKAERFIELGDIESAEESIKSSISVLDRSARKGAIHRNKAARRKSRLVRKLNAARSASQTPN